MQSSHPREYICRCTAAYTGTSPERQLGNTTKTTTTCVQVLQVAKRHFEEKKAPFGLLVKKKTFSSCKLPAEPAKWVTDVFINKILFSVHAYMGGWEVRGNDGMCLCMCARVKSMCAKTHNFLISIWLIWIGLDVRLDRYALRKRIKMIFWLFLPGFLYDVKKHWQKLLVVCLQRMPLWAPQVCCPGSCLNTGLCLRTVWEGALWSKQLTCLKCQEVEETEIISLFKR